MIAFLLSEIGDWRERHMRRILCLSSSFLAVMGLVGLLQPLLLAFASCVVFVLSGWAEIFYPRPDSGARLDSLSFPGKTLSLVAGKALSILVTWLGIVFALSPILAASAIAWGLSGGTIASCLLCWLSAYWVASAAGFYSRLIVLKAEGLLGLCVYLTWFFSSFFIDWLRPSNPIIQTLSILKLEGGRAPYLGIWAGIVAGAAFFALALPILGSKRRKRDA